MFGPDILPDNFPDVNSEDTPLYDMYKDNTMDEEGGLSGNNEYYENPIMDTGLECEIPMPEVNENYVNTSVVSPRGNIYA